MMSQVNFSWIYFIVFSDSLSKLEFENLNIDDMYFFYFENLNTNDM